MPYKDKAMRREAWRRYRERHLKQPGERREKELARKREAERLWRIRNPLLAKERDKIKHLRKWRDEHYRATAKARMQFYRAANGPRLRELKRAWVARMADGYLRWLIDPVAGRSPSATHAGILLAYRENLRLKRAVRSMEK